MPKKRIGRKVKRIKKIRGKKIKYKGAKATKKRPIRVKRNRVKRKPQHIRGKKP